MKNDKFYLNPLVPKRFLEPVIRQKLNKTQLVKKKLNLKPVLIGFGVLLVGFLVFVLANYESCRKCGDQDEAPQLNYFAESYWG